MSSVNKVTLLGRLGADPELRFTEEGNPILSFRMATTEAWTDRGGQKQERTEWHRVVFWKKTAVQLAHILHKGGRAFLEGKLRIREWQDRDGKKRATPEVHADYIIALDRKPKQSEPEEGGFDDADDPIPF